MTEFLLHYGLFLAETITIVIAIVVVIALIASTAQRSKGGDQLKVTSLNERYDTLCRALRQSVLDKADFKAECKEEKKRAKQEAKEKKKDKKVGGDPEPARRIFVLDFHGDIKATGVASLREEISAILSFSHPPSEVILRLDNAGGIVHEHGLAASQLLRIKNAGIPLTVAVDKVAASGGYMMACVADKIIAAPFAVVGSIGVLAQLPNFHRLLDRHGVDFEQFKAGEYKRTVTLFGENTDEDRAKFTEELEDTHVLFKDFVAGQRPVLDMDEVAKGEHWYGARAVDLKLVDELTTSDDYLLAASKDAKLFKIEFEGHKSLSEKLAGVVHMAADRLLLGWWRRATAPGTFSR